MTGEDNGNPLQYSCLGNPIDGSLVGYTVHGATEELDMTERPHFHFSLSCTGEGNGHPLWCSCLEIYACDYEIYSNQQLSNFITCIKNPTSKLIHPGSFLTPRIKISVCTTIKSSKKNLPFVFI